MANGDDDFINGFMDDYFEESDEHLATVRSILLSLEGLDDRSADRTIDPR